MILAGVKALILCRQWILDNGFLRGLQRTTVDVHPAFGALETHAARETRVNLHHTPVLIHGFKVKLCCCVPQFVGRKLALGVADGHRAG